MKIGTFACWLFGHKFMYWGSLSKDDWLMPTQIRFCIRCGIDKEGAK